MTSPAPAIDGSIHDAPIDAKDSPPAQTGDVFGDTLVPVKPDTSDPLDDASKGPVKFESAEHAAIADNLTLYMLDDSTVGAGDHKLIANWTVYLFPHSWIPFTTIDITFGMVIAFAGDFFTNPGKGFGKPGFESPDWEPISGPAKRSSPPPDWTKCSESFQNLVEAIVTDYDNNLYNLVDLLKKERDKLRQIEHDDPTKAALVYHEHDGIPTDGEWTAATMGWKSKTGLYGTIAWLNFDHFGRDAVTCYTAGHFHALQLARKAAEQTNNVEKSKLLNKAYLADAAACHYLTDLFSSGHQRAPRRAFHSDQFYRMGAGQLWGINVWDGMCRVMHDDDSSTGLVVRNKMGDSWTAFGDKQFFMPANAVNRARCVQCVQHSIDEVFNIGYKGTSNLDASISASFAALALMPIPYASTQDVQTQSVTKLNPAPLWIAKQDEMDDSQLWKTRKDPGDHSDYAKLEGKPEFLAGSIADENQLCANITKNSFRGDDQFPAQMPFSIRGSGTLQLVLTDLIKDAKASNLFANSYESITAMGYTALTIRTQERQLTTVERDAVSSIIYACTYLDASSAPANAATYILLFRARGLVKSGQTNASQWTIFVACWKIVDDNTRASNVALTFDFNQQTQPRLNLSKTMDWTPLFTTAEVANPTVASFSEQCGQLRFFVGRNLPISAQDKTLVPSIVSCRTVGHSKPGNLEISTANFAADMKSLKTYPTQRLFVDAGFDARILSLRTWVMNSTQPRLIFTCFDTANSTYRLGTVQFTSSDTAQIELSTKTYPSTGPTTAVKSSSQWSWMTENRQSGPSNLITIDNNVTWPRSSLTFERSADGGPNFSGPAEQHICQQDGAQASEFVCPLFNAIYPEMKSKSAGPDTPISSTIINVLYVKRNGKIMTAFREHRRSSPSNSAGSASWACTTSYVADDFATQARISAGYYYPIKWLSVQHPTLDPDTDGPNATAILQIFSYYGCVGFRLYGRKNAADKEIVLLGQQCYNGQASLGIGCTVDALFGGEFLAYKTRPFADYRQYQVPLTTNSSDWVDYWGGGSDNKPLGLLPEEMPGVASKGKGWRLPARSF